jgi:6-phosphogluconolactonase
VNELQKVQGASTGAVSAFAIDPAIGQLALLNQKASAGTDPCFIATDPAGHHVLIANYTSGTVAVLPIAADGRLEPAVSVRRGAGSGPMAARQAGPHAHQILLDPSSRFALWTDLGADRVIVDRFDALTGRLEPQRPEGAAIEPGSGPRHLAWHPSGRVVYLLNELSATVTTMSFNSSTGALVTIRTIAAREAGASGENSAAEIAASPNGAFLYASNRGDDDLAVFAIDARTLEPSPAAHVQGGGRTPRHFAIDPSGRWLIVANQNSDSLVVLRIDPATGIPSPTTAIATIPSPVNVLFVR